MVGGSLTACSKNTRLVSLECPGGSVDTDRVRLDVNGSHDVRSASPAAARASRNLSVGFGGIATNFTKRAFVLAGSLGLSVWVCGSELKSTSLHVVPEVKSKASIATIVIVRGRTINSLLFRKLGKA
jgi:hypothetical protein